MHTVEPVSGKVSSISTFALGDFVFVVREDEIFATAMEIKVNAEVFLAHG